MQAMPHHHPRLGIIGGGQLAKMTALAARELGCDVLVLERSAPSPAAPLANDALLGDWNDPATLLQLAAQVDVVSIENEFLDVDALEVMVRSGHSLYPGTATLRRIQDKLIQKQTLADAGLTTPRFSAVEQPGDLARLAKDFGWPMVLKTRRSTATTARGISPCARQQTLTRAGRLWAAGAMRYMSRHSVLTIRELAVIITRGATTVPPPFIRLWKRSSAIISVTWCTRRRRCRNPLPARRRNWRAGRSRDH